MLGIAVGDAFGAGYEGMTPREIRGCYRALTYRANEKNPGFHKAGQYTDDTQQSLAIAECLFSRQPFFEDTVGASLLHAFKRDPRWGYSSATREALESANNGQHLIRSSKFSKGNGAAMRSVPFGVLPTPEIVVTYADTNASATHGSDQARISSMVIGLASHYFFHEIGPPAEVGEFCYQMLPDTKSVKKDCCFGAKGHALAAKDLKRRFAMGGIPPNGVITAMAALSLLAWKGENPDRLRGEAVLLGGDTDTVCSIALGIAASRYGLDGPGVPPKYLNLGDALEDGPFGRNYIIEVAKKLATLLPIPVDRMKRENYSGKRQQMIVQGLDGLLDKVDPIYLGMIMKILMDDVHYRGDEVILALDASGYIPGVCASLVTKLPFRATKKALLSGEKITNVLAFREEGTPNPDIYAYNLPEGARVILVDDEIMTGLTIENAVNELRKNKIEVVAAVVPIEGTAYQARERLLKKRVSLFSHTKHNLT